MKYSAVIYAKALLESLEEGSIDSDAVIKRFAGVLHKNSDLKLAPAIIGLVERELVKQNGGRYVEVEFARPQGEGLMNEIRRNFSEKDKISVSTAPALIAGVRVTVDGERELDNSLSAKLKRIFSQ